MSKYTFVPWARLSNRRVLVTGASGLVGSAMVRMLLSRNDLAGDGIKVVVVVRNREKAERKFAEFLPRSDFELVVADLAAPFAVDGAVDYIVHCAGVTGNPKLFVERPAEVLNTAFVSTRSVLELARAKHSLGVVYLSSWEVYGTPANDGKLIDEGYSGYIDLGNVRTSYKESKRLGEQLCVAYANEYGVPAKIGRISITSGPEFDDTDQRFLPQFVRSARAGRDIVLKSKGETVRSHVYIDDCVTALLTILLKGEAARAYNIADPEAAVSIADIAQMVAAEAGVNVVFDVVDNVGKLGYNMQVKAVLDASKLLALGWRPQISFKAMIHEMVKGR